jgi:hypothetical protein
MSATPVFTIPESFRTIACKHRELAAVYDTVAGLLESPNTGVPALKTDQVVKSVGEMATEVGLSVEPATEAPAKRGRKAKAEEAPAVAEPKPAPKPAAPTMTPDELAAACKAKFLALANRDPDQAAASKRLADSKVADSKVADSKVADSKVADFKVADFSLPPADQPAAPTMTPGELAGACKTKFVALANRDPDQAAARKLLADFKVAKFSLLPADQHAAFFEAMKAAEKTAAAPSIVE